MEFRTLNYFEPTNIDKAILEKAGVSKTVQVPIIPFDDALPRYCLNNVKQYIEVFGGEVQLGWIFSIMGNIVLKLTAHAVVKTRENDLLCITPNPYRKKLRFWLDNSVAELIVNNCLPQKLLPLVDSKMLENYIALENKMDSSRLAGSGSVSQQQVQEIRFKMQILYPDILQLAMENTSLKDCCFCGSNKKRGKCCR